MPKLNIELTDDPLKNICLMAPYLDINSQNRVFGMMCGLLGYTGGNKEEEEEKEMV